MAIEPGENAISNNVSAFSITSPTGALSPVAGAPFPTVGGSYSVASVAVDLTGHFAYVANSASNNVSGYAINAATGALAQVPGSPFAAGTGPYSVAAGTRFLPDLGALSCGQETSLKSLQGSSPTSIVFENTSTQVRQVYWLDYNGQRVLYNTLSAGSSYIQATFLTHPWVITDTVGGCIAVYTPITGLSRVIINQ